jgi:hypothetical protein
MQLKHSELCQELPGIMVNNKMLHVFVVVVMKVLSDLFDGSVGHEYPYIVLGTLTPVASELQFTDRPMTKVLKHSLKLTIPSVVAVDQDTVEVK